jgi:FkbM family methyltransferase
MSSKLNNLKTLIKSNLNLTIIFDYLIGLTGVNFEKEYALIQIVKTKNPVILDIGAHKGESIKNFLKYKPNSIIYAFEPNKKLANNLKKRFYANKKISIFDSAVSVKKELNLFIPYINGYPFSGLSSINKKNIIDRLDNYYGFEYKKNITFKKEKINTITIDELLIKPDLIKIDAEGYEFEILKTAIKTTKENKPIFIIEYNNNSFNKISKLLAKYGYERNIYNNIKNRFHLEKINLKKLREIQKEKNLVNIVYVHKNSKKDLIN